jgi:hypothetical protein
VANFGRLAGIWVDTISEESKSGVVHSYDLGEELTQMTVEMLDRLQVENQYREYLGVTLRSMVLDLLIRAVRGRRIPMEEIRKMKIEFGLGYGDNVERDLVESLALRLQWK